MLLSKTEDLVYRELKKQGFVVFTIKDLRLLLGINATKAYNLMKALKKKGAIRKFNSAFVFSDVDEFLAGTSLHYPSYVSFWSALNYYRWSDQTPKKIFLATTRYSKEIASFKYITLAKKRFFGYMKVGDITIAEKEKAIIDSLLFPKYSGGMREIKTSLEASFKELNKKKLISYALKTESKIAIRRLGFLLEEMGYKKIDILKKNMGKGYELLDPSLKRKNKFNKIWLLDINW